MDSQKPGGRARGITCPGIAGDPTVKSGPHDHGEGSVEQKQGGKGEGHSLQTTFARVVSQVRRFENMRPLRSRADILLTDATCRDPAPMGCPNLRPGAVPQYIEQLYSLAIYLGNA